MHLLELHHRNKVDSFDILLLLYTHEDFLLWFTPISKSQSESYLSLPLFLSIYTVMYVFSFFLQICNKYSIYAVDHQMLLWTAVAVSPRWVASHPAARRRPSLESLKTHTAPPHRRLWHPRVPRRSTSHQGSCQLTELFVERQTILCICWIKHLKKALHI